MRSHTIILTFGSTQKVVQLSDDIIIQTVVVANGEHYASGVKDFQLLGSDQYPTEKWVLLGNFRALQDAFGRYRHGGRHHAPLLQELILTFVLFFVFVGLVVFLQKSNKLQVFPVESSSGQSWYVLCLCKHPPPLGRCNLWKKESV